VLLKINDRFQLATLIAKAMPAQAPVFLEALSQLAPDAPISSEQDDPRSTAFSSIIHALAEAGISDLLPQLLRYCEHRPLHTDVVYGLAALADRRAISLLKEAFVDPDERVRTWAFTGIDCAARRSGSDEVVLEAAFDALAAELFDGSALNAASYCVSMFRIDAIRAMRVLTSPPFFDPNRESFHGVVHALNERAAVLPTSRLIEVLAQLNANSARAEYPIRLARREILHALSRSDPAISIPIIEKEIDDPDATTRREACIALARAHGMVDPYRNYSRAQYATWPRPVRLVADLTGLQLQIESNGLSAVFGNEVPGSWRTFVEKLNEIGAAESASLIQQLAQSLGIRDLSPEGEQAARLNWTDAACEAERTLSSCWCQDGDRRDNLIVKYMLRYREHFVRT